MAFTKVPEPASQDWVQFGYRGVHRQTVGSFQIGAEFVTELALAFVTDTALVMTSRCVNETVSQEVEARSTDALVHDCCLLQM